MPIKISNLVKLPEEKREKLIQKIAELFKKEWAEFRFSELSEAGWQNYVRESMGSVGSKLSFRLVALDEHDNFVGTVAADEISSIKKEDWEPNESVDVGALSWTPWLRGMAVAEDYRGKGLGALLVLDLAKRVKNLGYEELYLYHQPDVGRFYEAVGMSSIGYAPKQWVNKEQHIKPPVCRGAIDIIIEKAQEICKRKGVAVEQMVQAESELYHTSHSGFGKSSEQVQPPSLALP